MEALESELPHLRKYERWSLVFPKRCYIPGRLYDGLQEFCYFHNFQLIWSWWEFDDEPFVQGDSFIVLAENGTLQTLWRNPEGGGGGGGGEQNLNSVRM